MLRELIIHGLEKIGANPPEPIGPPEKGEAILVECIDEKEMAIWNEATELQKDICERAQKLYLLMRKCAALREMFWSNMKLEYPTVYDADQKGRIIGLRIQRGDHVMVAIDPPKDKPDGPPQTVFGPVPPGWPEWPDWPVTVASNHTAPRICG